MTITDAISREIVRVRFPKQGAGPAPAGPVDLGAPLVDGADWARYLEVCRRAAAACGQSHRAEAWRREQFEPFLSAVAGWVRHTAAREVRACYVGARDAQLAVFVVPQAGRFDFGLSEKLTQLDVELAARFPDCPCDVHQVPAQGPGGVGLFADPARAVQLVYGD